MKPKGIIPHHTVTRKDASARLIRKNHMQKRRFKDIGYHFLIRFARRRKEWIIEKGRPIRQKGAHCPGHQDWIGIAVAGEYDDHDLPPGAINCLIYLCAELCAEYGFNPRTKIRPHRDFRDTVCPGDRFVAILPELIEWLVTNLPQ